MFGLGMGEIVVIAIVALLFLGPDRLPHAAKTIGKTIRGFRAQTRELTDSLEKDTELGDAVRELRSALRDDPLRTRTPPVPAAAADEDEDLSAGDEDGDVEFDDSVQLAQPVDAGPEDSTVRPEGTIAEEPDVPTIRPASGVIAKGTELADDISSDLKKERPGSDHG